MPHVAEHWQHWQVLWTARSYPLNRGYLCGHYVRWTCSCQLLPFKAQPRINLAKQSHHAKVGCAYVQLYVNSLLGMRGSMLRI